MQERLHEPGVFDIHPAGVACRAEVVMGLQRWWQGIPVGTEHLLYQTFHDPAPGKCLKTISATTRTIERKAGTPSQNHYRVMVQYRAGRGVPRTMASLARRCMRICSQTTGSQQAPAKKYRNRLAAIHTLVGKRLENAPER